MVNLAVDPTLHIGLVKEFVRRTGPHSCWEEAEGVATLAMVRACADFKPELGFKFSTFAARYILTALQRKKAYETQKCRDKNRTRPLTDATAARVGYTPAPSEFEQQDEELDRNLQVDAILCKVSERSAELLLARASGMTLLEIAKQNGVSWPAVQSWERMAFRELQEATGKDMVYTMWSQVERANAGRRRRMGFPVNDKSKVAPREMPRY